MLLSIIVPTYNRAELIVQTIDSVLAQSCPAWELVIVDDHSADDTEAVVKPYCQADQRIRFSRRTSPTKGAPTCRNEGARASTGELLVFLDSDDLLAPHCVEQRLRFMADHPDVEMLVCQAELFREQPGDIGLLVNRLDYDNDLDHFLMNDNIWLISSPTWRRSAFERIGEWDEDLPCWQDWEQHIRALAKGINYDKLDVVDSYLRQGQAGRQAITTGHGGASPAYVAGALAAAGKVRQTLADGGLDSPERRQLIAFNVYEMLYSLSRSHRNRDGRRLANEARRLGVLSTGQTVHYWMHSLMLAGLHGLERGAEWWEHQAYRQARSFRPLKWRNRVPRVEAPKPTAPRHK